MKGVKIAHPSRRALSFAVAPAGAVNIARSAAGTVSFQWRVPSDPTQQPDIMAASASNIGGKSNTPVSMTFSHLMSAVKVVTGDDFQAATVTSVKFKYIKSTGDYEFGTGWQNVTNVDNYELKPNKLISATPGEEIVGGANTFMMIPQDFATQAELEITLTDAASGQTRTLKTRLTGSWEEGNAALNNPITGIKTVYDPTPAGYQIPTYHQLREFGNNIVYDSTKIALVFTVGRWTIQLPVLGLGYKSAMNTTLYGTTCIAMSCVSTAQRPSGNPYLLMMNVRKGLIQGNTNDRGNPPSKWWGEAGNMSGGCYTVLPVREV